MDKKELIEKIRGKLIVSCQALPHEPLYTEKGGVMPLLAKAAQEGGACGIRANSVRDIKEIKEMVDLPVIGIIKIDYPGYEAYITPTMKEVDELVSVNCDIIAIDCTKNTRPGNKDATKFIKEIKEKYPNQLLMADCAELDEVLAASEAGIDFVGTTLAGYTKTSVKTEGPNFELIKEIVEKCKTPLIAEGKIHTPEQAKKVYDLGATSIVVGGAITRPKEITERFVAAINK